MEQQKINKKKVKRKKQPIEEEFSDSDSDMEIEMNINKDLLEKQKMELDSDSDEGDNKMDEELVNVEFEFYDADPNQFMSVKSLLNTGILYQVSTGSSELADIVTQQVEIGCMIGVYDEEEDETKNKNPKLLQNKDILGFATLISLNQHSNSKCLFEVMDYVKAKNKQYNVTADAFQQILDKNKIGLYLNERILNLSPQLVPTLHAQLQEDLKWLKEDDPETAKNFNFDYVLIVTKCSKENSQRKNKQIKQNSGQQQYLYPRFEDFIFLEHAEHSFMFETKLVTDSNQVITSEKQNSNQIDYKLVLLIQFNKFVKAISKLPEYIETK